MTLAAFAVNSIRQWWRNLGRTRYPNATRLLITADGGGSNGSRVGLWKRELQKLANELGLDIMVNHLPPGTSAQDETDDSAPTGPIPQPASGVSRNQVTHLTGSEH
jgi:hypothetical protein